jgi:TfoX/Sxy family transcriptional regulator of competence genes
VASKQASVDFIVEQIAGAGAVSARKMFGEYGIYCGEKMVALVCDDQLFVKPTAGGRALIGQPNEVPPYPGAKPCSLISGELWEDREWMSALIAVTARELTPATRKKAALPAKKIPLEAKAAPSRARKSSRPAKPKRAKARRKP